MDTIASDVIRSPSLETSTSNYAADANDWHARKIIIILGNLKNPGFIFKQCQSSGKWQCFLNQLVPANYYVRISKRNYCPTRNKVSAPAHN